MRVYLSIDQMKRIDNPDTDNEDLKYWAKVLKSHDLKATRGTDEDFICYVGGDDDLLRIADRQRRKTLGQKKPIGHGPDS